VLHTTWLTPAMIRLGLGGEGLAGFDAGEFTDHYVKLIFPPPGAPYGLPVDPAAVEDEHPRELWPVTRAYTVRAWDSAAGVLTVDLVRHGDDGIAPAWAAAARPGDRISLFGPGGAYAPAHDADWHLLVGDESALPAIAATVEALPAAASAVVIVEVAGPEEEQPVVTPADVELTWIHRGAATGAPGGHRNDPLLAAVRAATERGGDVDAFVHGEADMVRAVRRHLRVERGVPRGRLSASGYWRRGRTDEGWRQEKKDWNAAVEADERESVEEQVRPSTG
jgi:NADPH-dependent ferric siderophore reductase